MRMGLLQLFDAICGNASMPFTAEENSFGDLFSGGNDKDASFLVTDSAGFALIAGIHSETSADFSVLPEFVRCFYELSANAFDIIVHAWMSEFPITPEIIRFGKNILSLAEKSIRKKALGAEAMLAGRQAAEQAAADRGNPDVLAVQAAAYKTWHEIHRMLGLLRFCPDENSVYTAYCEPDHFILPALGPHFKDRFGKNAWAVIDKKRSLCLRCISGQNLEFSGCSENYSVELPASQGKWEQLWKQYHSAINNETRANPKLQKSFMPKRYWKYLSEM